MPPASRLVLAGLLACGPLAAVPAAGQAPAPAPAAVDPKLAVYASTMDSVRLPDGRIIHLVCMGKGSPTVILSAGGGDWGVTWNKVQPAVAEKTRVCTWDRAGFGLSQMPPKPQTVDATTTDLEAALKAGKIDGPYVAVGHSLGGLETLLFADREPDKVVGMVLVASTFVKPPPPGNASLPEPPGLAVFRKCSAALRAGAVRAGRPDPDGCLKGQEFPPEYPPELRAVLDKHPAQMAPEALASAMDFMAAIFNPKTTNEDIRIVAKPDRNYGQMPLIVLTAAEVPPGFSADQVARVTAQMRRDNDELAAFSKRGVNRMVASSHYIQQIKPQAVIDAIDEVVDEARADMPQPGKPGKS